MEEKTIKTKLCPCCKIEKNIDEFGNAKYSQNGHNCTCKECDNERARKYRKTVNGILHTLFNSAKRSVNGL